MKATGNTFVMLIFVLPLFRRRDLGTSQSVSWDKKNYRHKTAKYESRETDHRQTELDNMLLKKSVSNDVNRQGTFTQGFKDGRKIKRKVSQNLHDLQNLLIKLESAEKVSAEKAWLIYEFPFSLTPGDKPNVVQT